MQTHLFPIHRTEINKTHVFLPSLAIIRRLVIFEKQYSSLSLFNNLSKFDNDSEGAMMCLHNSYTNNYKIDLSFTVAEMKSIEVEEKQDAVLSLVHRWG